jgi:K+-sensing histidine kinase KdpD
MHDPSSGNSVKETVKEQSLPSAEPLAAHWLQAAAVIVAVVAVVTLALGAIKDSAVGPQHLVFFYLLPIAAIAGRYGTLAGIGCALLAVIAAAYYLYDPVYSFQIANPVELGELLWFAALAIIGGKCAADLVRPLLFAQQRVAEENKS